jgi:hypothetical protein
MPPKRIFGKETKQLREHIRIAARTINTLLGCLSELKQTEARARGGCIFPIICPNDCRNG